MKKIFLLSASLCLSAFVVHSQTTYDVFTYTEPKGFKKETKTGMVTYTKADSKTGTYCIISLYEQTQSSGDIKKDFETDWQDLVVKSLDVKDAPKADNSDDITGWKTYSGGSNFEFGGGTSMVLLTTAKKENTNASIMIVTNGQKFLTDADAFLNKLKLGKPQSTAASISTTTTNNNNSNSNIQVWMNAQSNPIDYMAGADATNAKFYVVFPDGDYCSEMPYAGLQTFDKEKSKKSKERTWGKFSMQSGVGSFISAYENIAVKKITATKMEKTGYAYSFYKCYKVDGLKLNGGYSHIPNWSKDSYYTQAGCRPVIYFKPDGSFDDRGIFITDGECPTKNIKDASGTGTYSCNNFTLTLKYSDGRIVYKALTGVADKNPAVDDNVIYIGTNPFYKK
jgi:hypothetical protein